MLQDAYVDVNGISLHYVTRGDGPLLLFLHGFPAFWYLWRDQLAAFGDSYRVIAPDMRGYNLSAKPTSIEHYRLAYLVEDLRQLLDQVGGQPCVVIGHDWGGIVAWEFAATHPSYLEKLIVLTVPPLNLLRRMLYANPAQRQAAEYMLLLHSPHAEDLLSANTFAMLVRSELQASLDRGHFTERDRHAYLTAWSQPNAITGGVNYYRAAGFVDLFSEEGRQQITNPEQEFAVPPVMVPTLLIWGEQDSFKVIEVVQAIQPFVPQLTLARIPDGTHWIVYEQPERINALIRDFITATV